MPRRSKSRPKTIQARIPRILFNDIKRIQRDMQKETVSRFGKKKPVTFVRAALEFQKKKNVSFFGKGGLI